ncbi:NAD(P)H-hydrate dehydratase [Cellulosilyticum sp. I15G10I2]|uniref:NAD(P)H-hydrate dehydratase n=1 Tax=Cellulosilyticum sp. I15G10I2 TaxID=1892843 RepID=UPI0009F2DF96|nr:NAD(P)H-hydrate dehydratase [Cellulosilyticum sp. I15G10I2]
MTPKQIQQIDEEAISQYQIPGILLMEHAAYHLFRHIKEKYKKGSILIVCGPGNNGGDGFALARQIKIWGNWPMKVLMLAGQDQLQADGKTYYRICQHIGVEMIQVSADNIEIVYKEIMAAEIIVDALFGTGLSRKVSGAYADVITHINRSSAYIMSVDIPSGIDGTTGQIQEAAVKADITISFSAAKLGLYIYPAIDYIGELKIVDIGIPQAILENIETPYYTIQKEEMKKLLPHRYTRSNKATYGKVLVIGGQRGMSGAVALTSMAALKAGAGIVTAAVPRAIHDIMENKLTEIMTIALQDQDGHIAAEARGQIQALIEKYDVIAIGPGIGRSEAIKAILLVVLASDKPCIVDADALYFLGELIEVVETRKAETIITPHPGEMARLTNLTVQDILDNPHTVTMQYAVKNHVISLLKIERTVVADPKGNIYININGNSGMAKGGSGDLLTGIIAGLLAQKLEAKHAARLGVYLHARAGDIMKALKTEYTLLPSDLYQGMDEAFKELIDD